MAKIKLKKKQVVLKYTMFIWIWVIWFLSSLPAKHLPKMDTFNFDKVAHLAVYFILSILIFNNYKLGLFGKNNRYVVLLFAIILASLDEAHQVISPNRVVSIYDLAANLSGLILGYFIVFSRKFIL
jgi:VanZ family protein